MFTEPKYITLSEPSNPAEPRHMAYYEIGEANNANIVLCVHGLSRNGLDFEVLAQSLAPKYRVICPDMAGRGKSNWLTNKDGYNYYTYLADILLLINQLKITKFDWVGTSMGGIIGMMLAAQYPQFFKKMVLNDVGSVVSAKGLNRILGYVGKQTVFANEAEAMTTLKSIITFFGISSEEQWQQMFRASFVKLPDGRVAFAYDPEINKPFRETALKGDAITDVDLSAIWNAVQCPVLILRGAISDILTRETANKMCERQISTKLIEFAGVGHAPALLDENQITVIKDWLG